MVAVAAQPFALPRDHIRSTLRSYCLRMSALISIRARATDASHLELLRPLTVTPAGEFDILIPAETSPPAAPGVRAAAFREWAGRPRRAVGLSDAGRDSIYED
jgi:hypothetical protein